MTVLPARPRGVPPGEVEHIRAQFAEFAKRGLNGSSANTANTASRTRAASEQSQPLDAAAPAVYPKVSR